MADALFWLGAILCVWRALWLEWLAITAWGASVGFRRRQAQVGAGWVLMAAVFVVLAVFIAVLSV